MHTENLTESMLKSLELHGYTGKIVSSEHIHDLKTEIEQRHRNGQIAADIHAEHFLDFEFDVPAHMMQGGSLIIAASPQPSIRATFFLNGKTISCLIPSNYCHATDGEAQNILEDRLNGSGFCVRPMILPFKLLAVRSGLARYGRNNITYVDGMGSYFRLSAFYSDIPCPDDDWKEAKSHDRCQGCSACLQACPAKAISADRFLLRAERCIAFYNEIQGDFPMWIDPSWHNCLVGCLHCQRVCPLNKDFLRMVEDGPSFAHHETNSLLEGLPKEKIPPETADKLKKLYLTEYTEVLGRNLRALLREK